MKKLVFVALTMLLLLMTVSFSAHAEDDIQLCYTLTSDISAALSISNHRQQKVSSKVSSY